MQGNSDVGARWLGGVIVLTSLALIFGIHWALSHYRAQVQQAREVAPQPPVPVIDDPTLDEQKLSAKDESEANRRVKELLNQSEDLRVIRDEWMQIWYTDHPTHLNPYRIDGAIQ